MRQKRKTEPEGGNRRHGCNFYHYFLVALSFYFVNTWSFYHYAKSQVNKVNRGGVSTNDSLVSPTDHLPGKDICGSVNASSTNGGIIGESVYRHWNMIDEITHQEYPDAKVSGGIFLYPRQASILTHLIRRMHAGRTEHQKTITICETGYGSGHSMALFQDASSSIGPIRVVSFDKFDRPYQLPIWHRLNKTMSGNKLQDTDNSNKKSFDYVKGNSCKTVPKHLPSFQCDILHGSSLCPTDNIDLVENSPCGVLMTSTAMISLKDRQVYFGKNAQWRKLRERNCISNIVCFREDGTVDLKRDFVFAKKGSAPTGEFCVAVTTGRCQRGRADSEISPKCLAEVEQLLKHLDLNDTCPMHQIEMPI